MNKKFLSAGVERKRRRSNFAMVYYKIHGLPVSLLNGDRVHYVMVSKIQWKPFWLATQLYPQNDWTGWQFLVSIGIGVCALAPLGLKSGFILSNSNSFLFFSDEDVNWQLDQTKKNTAQSRWGPFVREEKERVWFDGMIPTGTNFRFGLHSCLVVLD